MEDAKKLPHSLSMEERSRLTLTGAREVLHFEEEQVELSTDLGVLTVLGRSLRLKCLSLEEGRLIIEGQISVLAYEEPKQRRRRFP